MRIDDYTAIIEQTGAILEELLRRKLNGEVEGRAAELDAARELLAAEPA